MVGEIREFTSQLTYVWSVILLHFSAALCYMQLPGVLTAIRNLHTIDFEADEYDVKGRLTCLIDKWGIARSFLEQFPHQGQVVEVCIQRHMWHKQCRWSQLSTQDPVSTFSGAWIIAYQPRINTTLHCCQVSFEMYRRNCPLSMWLSRFSPSDSCLYSIRTCIYMLSQLGLHRCKDKLLRAGPIQNACGFFWCWIGAN